MSDLRTTRAGKAVLPALPITGAIPSCQLSVDRGPFRFVSGLAVDTNDTNIVRKTDLIDLAEGPYRQQAASIYARLEQATADTGGLGSLLRLHLYQQTKRQFPVLEDVRLEFEGDRPTPSSGIGVELLRGSCTTKYEIDAVGVSAQGVKEFGSPVVLDEVGVGQPASHYTQALRFGTHIFLAGMIPLDPKTSTAVRGFSDVTQDGRWLQRNRSHPDSRIGPIASQTWSLYSRIDSFLRHYGLTFNDICHVTMFVSDPGDLATALRVHERVFGGSEPSLQIVGVDEVGHRGTLIEIECIVSTRPIVRVNGTQPFFDPIPDVCLAGSLVTTSDHLGFARRGILCRNVSDIDFLEKRHVVDGLRALATPADEPTQCLIAQLYSALSNLLDSLRSAQVQITSLGHLLIRITRPHDIGIVDQVCKVVLGDTMPAVTVVGCKAIPQSERAVVAVSGVGGIDVPDETDH